MRRLLLLALPVTLFGALAACGSTGDDTATGTAATADATAATTATGAGGTSNSSPTSDPQAASSDSSRSGGTAASTTSGADAPARGPAFVEQVGTTVGADRVVTVDIVGQVPTPCHRPGWQTGPLGSDRRIAVDVYSVPPKPDELCAQVLTPFTDQVRLGPLEPGSYVVTVNGTDRAVTVP